MFLLCLFFLLDCPGMYADLSLVGLKEAIFWSAHSSFRTRLIAVSARTSLELMCRLSMMSFLIRSTMSTMSTMSIIKSIMFIMCV